FEGKNYQRFIDVLAQQADTSLPPCPELRTDVIHDGNVTLAHLASHSPIKRGRVDDDGQVGPASIGYCDQAMESGGDRGQMADDFGDADHREILRVDHGVAAGGAHPVSAYSEELQ